MVTWSEWWDSDVNPRYWFKKVCFEVLHCPASQTGTILKQNGLVPEPITVSHFTWHEIYSVIIYKIC